MSESKRGGKREGAGRPSIQIIPSTKKRSAPTVSLDELELLCRMGATHKHIAAYFHITVRSLQLLKKKNKEVHDILEMGIERGKVSLLKEIFERRKKSDAVLIFCAKNSLGWTDKVQSELSGPGGKPIETKVTTSDTSLLDEVLADFEKRKIDGNESTASEESVSGALPSEADCL